MTQQEFISPRPFAGQPAPANTQPASVSRKMLWTGRILSALPVLFLLFDGAIKFTNMAPVMEAFRNIEVPTRLAAGIGLLELACTILYIIPRTSILGAILLTGFLGGATAIHVRSDTPFYMPLIIGGLLWAGLFLRDNRLRNVL